MVDNDGVGGCCGVMDTRQQSGTAGDNQTTSAAQRSEYLRNKALAAAIDDGGSVAGAARRYGVSRQRAYKIKRRWDTDVFCQIFVGRFGVSFSPFERLFLGRFGFGQSCGLSVIA